MSKFTHHFRLITQSTTLQHILKIEFTSGNAAVIEFETEAERENYINYLFLTSGKLIKNVARIFI